MTGAPAEKGACDVVLRLGTDVILHEVKLTSVQIEEKVPVSSQQGTAVQGATQPAAGVGEGLLDVVQRFKHIEDPRMLVEELSGKWGTTACSGKQQDVLPRWSYGQPAVIAGGSPPGVLSEKNK